MSNKFTKGFQGRQRSCRILHKMLGLTLSKAPLMSKKSATVKGPTKKPSRVMKQKFLGQRIKNYPLNP